MATLVPEVPDDLLRPEQLDPTDVNNSRPVLPEHLPVHEAHLAAIQATTRASSTWPINPDAPELIAAPLAPEILQRFQDASRARLARGEVLNVAQGVTFRPYVVGPVTDTAVVMDCELAGHYWVKADTGELVPPDEMWPAGPGRIVEVGLRETLVLRDGRWLVAVQSRSTPRPGVRTRLRGVPLVCAGGSGDADSTRGRLSSNRRGPTAGNRSCAIAGR